MNAKLTFTALVLVILGIVAVAFAQPTDQPPQAAPQSAEEQKEELARVEQLRQQFVKEQVELRAQIFKKRADLARLAGQPDADVKEIQKVMEEIAELRANLQEKCAEYSATVGPAVRPFAPRQGAGPYGLVSSYPHAPGRGYELGPGAGMGIPHVGRGAPRHFAPGYGLGIPHSGRGAGLGPGRGAGFGPGRGAGPGAGRGLGLGPGRGMRGWGAGRWGRGPFFTDEDNDGLCDYWEGAVPPGTIPHRPEGEPPMPPVHEAPKPPETK